MPKDDKETKPKYKPYIGRGRFPINFEVPKNADKTVDLAHIYVREVTNHCAVEDPHTSTEKVVNKPIYYEYELRRRKDIQFVSEIEGARKLLSTQYLPVAAKNMPSGFIYKEDGTKMQVVYESRLKRDPSIYFISELEEIVRLLPPHIAARYAGRRLIPQNQDQQSGASHSLKVTKNS